MVTGLSSDLSPYTITQWTGHSSLKAMKPYMVLADKVKKESMKKFDDVYAEWIPLIIFEWQE